MSAVDTEFAAPPALADRVAMVRAQLAPIRSRHALIDSYRRESLCRLATPVLVHDSAAEVLDIAYALRWLELEAEPPTDPWGGNRSEWWMNSIASPATLAPSSREVRPDYCLRALALWPRLDLQRLARVRHDAYRIATLVSRRTTLPRPAILALLGAVPEVTQETDSPGREN